MSLSTFPPLMRAYRDLTESIDRAIDAVLLWLGKSDDVSNPENLPYFAPAMPLFSFAFENMEISDQLWELCTEDIQDSFFYSTQPLQKWRMKRRFKDFVFIVGNRARIGFQSMDTLICFWLGTGVQVWAYNNRGLENGMIFRILNGHDLLLLRFAVT